METTRPLCQRCASRAANQCQTSTPGQYPTPFDITTEWLCPACARSSRRLPIPPAQRPVDSEWVDRAELIDQLDQFFAAAGIDEICARCHHQGTGCCPPSCRVMGARGCNPENRYGKTVFCAAFLCSALLNAIREIDPECARVLRWVREQLGPIEFHLYEMITRVPAAHREPERPLRLPPAYPVPPLAEYAAKLSQGLPPLVEEILEIRRRQ